MTPEQLGVLLNASEHSDLAGVLGDWSAQAVGDPRSAAVSSLATAVVALVHEGLIEAHLSETLPGETLTAEGVAVVVVNQHAWWPEADEGLEQVCWLGLTDVGWSVLSAMSRAELYSYNDR